MAKSIKFLSAKSCLSQYFSRNLIGQEHLLRQSSDTLMQAKENRVPFRDQLVPFADVSCGVIMRQVTKVCMQDIKSKEFSLTL